MSLIDKASLIQIPSGYKSTKLYSIEPTNGDGDFTFARSSSGTRVNSEGLIEVASVLGIEEIVNGDFATDSDWIKGSGWTISGGKANCDGSQLSVSDLQQNYDFSDGIKYKLTFDIIVTNGSVTPYIGGVNTISVTSTETNVTRYVIAGSSNHIKLRASSDFIGSIDNVSVKEVIENDVPRLDYSGGASCASLLLEPQRTNLITYSNDFTNAVWLNTEGVTITANDTTSPDGTTNADKITPQATSNYHRLKQSLTVTASTPYTFSCFVKKADYDYFMIRTSDTQNNNVGFNLLNGTITYQASGYSGFIEAYNNGWYRIGYVRTFDATIIQIGMRSQPTEITDNNIATFTGDGTSGAYLYGAQLEQGSYPTSYIPSNSNSQTTRSADVCNNAGTSATFNSTEGVLFAEIAALYDDGTYRQISLTESSGGGDVLTLDYSSTSNQIRSFIRVNGAAQSLTHTLTDETQYNKIAIKYKDTHEIWVNGSKVASSSLTLLPIDINLLTFDNGAGGGDFYGKTKQLMVFNEALSDEELADLTGAVHQTFNSLATFYGYTIL